MEFGNKREGVVDMLIYALRDQSFVVSNNSRICPEQNCEFQFKDTGLVYQPGSNRSALDGLVLTLFLINCRFIDHISDAKITG